MQANESVVNDPVAIAPVAIAPVGIDDAEHYIWGEVCDGWHLLKLDGFSVIRERVPAGVSETRHRHACARQFFYVLDGTAVIEVDGTRHALPAGKGLHVPPGTAHQFSNESESDVHFLVVSVPKSHGDRENLDDFGATA
jgi:mannose-6-phosphate isomerase-like protein (cupin superfamily)